MAADAIVFAMANPVPEIAPVAAVPVARWWSPRAASDYPNQVNNSVAFPGIFRGAPRCPGARHQRRDEDRAAEAIAGCVSDDELNPFFIIPSVFDSAVPKAVAGAISGKAARG